jgi:hypothetical protein
MSQGRGDPCNRYDVEAEKIDWTQWAPANTSVRPCEGFEFREGKITLVTEVSMTDLCHLDVTNIPVL